MTVEETMYSKAAEFIKERYPTGWGGAAVIHTADDRYLISVAPEVFNASAELCIETGAICEAHKYNAKVTHCLCLVRNNETSPFKVLTPCGICRERLKFWGEDLLVAVTSDDSIVRFVRLGELMPYYWGRAYGK